MRHHVGIEKKLEHMKLRHDIQIFHK